MKGRLTQGSDTVDNYSFVSGPNHRIRVDIDDADPTVIVLASLINPAGTTLGTALSTSDLTLTLPANATAGTYRVSLQAFYLGGATATDYTLHITDHQHTYAEFGSLISDGQTFTLGDGTDILTFEFDDAALPAPSVTPGHVRVPFRNSDSAHLLAQTIRDVINSQQVQATVDVVAALGDSVAGLSSDPFGTFSTSIVVNLAGNAVADEQGSLNFGEIGSRVFGTTADFNNEHGYNGDSNRFRDQGQVLIQSNRILASLDAGILVHAGDRVRNDLIPQGGSLPHPGAPKNFSELNTDRLAPGVTIVNNIVAVSGQTGIEFRGDSITTTPGAVPFGRIVNNTIYGPAAAPAFWSPIRPVRPFSTTFSRPWRQGSRSAGTRRRPFSAPTCTIRTWPAARVSATTRLRPIRCSWIRPEAISISGRAPKGSTARSTRWTTETISPAGSRTRWASRRPPFWLRITTS